MDERVYVAQALFARLEERGVEFSVLGDAEAIPQAIASDLDLAVAPGDFAQLDALLSGFCHDLGLRLVQRIRHERSARYYVIAWLNNVGALRFLAPDFCFDYRRAGRLLLAAEELLGGRRPALDAGGAPRGFWVPPPDVQFAYYLTKKVDKLALEDAHGEYLSRQWRADPDGALRRLVRFWPELPDNGLLARAASRDDWSEVREQLPRLRGALHDAVRLTPLDLLGEAGRVAGRALRPTGLRIALVGPDGSGKSGLAERIVHDLAPAFRQTRCYHLRPRLLRASAGSAAPVTEPYARSPRGALASAAKVCWLALDCLLGYALQVRPFVTRSGLAVFDRYFHDLLADPRRYRYGAPPGLARLAARLVPQPDLWLVLDAPVEALQARKREVTEQESELQRRAYLALGAQLANAVILDAGRGAPLVAAEAAQAILAQMEIRLERRHVPPSPANPLGARVLLFFCAHRVPLLSKLVRLMFNSDIYCRIRSPILMAHPYGIVIHSRARIGSRVTVMQQVTIGSKDRDHNVAPVIEDDVYIGAGARVLGGIRVGRGSVIGANAVVTRDVPSYSIVVGANRVLHKQRGEGEDAAPGANDDWHVPSEAREA